MTKPAATTASPTAAINYDSAIGELSTTVNGTALAVSNESTLKYGHEPFDTFKHKVMELCEAKFGHCGIIVEHMKGGGYNRVVAVTVTSPKPKKWSCAWWRARFKFAVQLPAGCILKRKMETKPKSANYVVRLPREQDWDYGILHEISILNVARPHVEAPIPRIISFDSTSSNILGSPYTIQERLEGKSLQAVWKGLNLPQRMSAARQMLKFTLQLQSATSRQAGIVVPSATLGIGGAVPKFKVAKFPLTLRPDHPNVSLQPPTPPNTSQTTLELLLDLCDRQIDFQAIDNVHGCCAHEWYKLRKIIISLYDLGFLPNDESFYFCHLDFFPRNMLVQIADNSNVTLTGVLDWDAQFSYFCPKFVAFCAPYWMWNSEHQERHELEYKEYLVLTEPKIEQDMMMKKLFDEVAGEEWQRFAYTPEYIIARRLFRFLKKGIDSTELMEDVEDLIDEWQTIHPLVELQENYYFISAEEGYLDEGDSDVEDARSDDSSNSSLGDDILENLYDLPIIDEVVLEPEKFE